MSCRNVEVDRPLMDWEKELLRTLMDGGKPEAYRFIPQIEDVNVVVQCDCGCPRMYFADPSAGDFMILASMIIKGDDGGSSNYYVFAFGEMLGGLEAIHYNRFGEVREHPEQAFFRKVYEADAPE